MMDWHYSVGLSLILAFIRYVPLPRPDAKWSAVAYDEEEEAVVILSLKLASLSVERLTLRHHLFGLFFLRVKSAASVVGFLFMAYYHHPPNSNFPLYLLLVNILP